MTITPSDAPDMDVVWRQLLEERTTPGIHQLRLNPEFRFYASISNPGATLGLNFTSDEAVPFDDRELAGSEQITITHTADEVSGTHIELTLRHEESKDFFLALCADLIPRVIAKPSEAAAATCLIRRFNAWQRFLKRTSDGKMSKLDNRASTASSLLCAALSFPHSALLTPLLLGLDPSTNRKTSKHVRLPSRSRPSSTANHRSSGSTANASSTTSASTPWFSPTTESSSIWEAVNHWPNLSKLSGRQS